MSPTDREQESSVASPNSKGGVPPVAGVVSTSLKLSRTSERVPPSSMPPNTDGGGKAV